LNLGYKYVFRNRFFKGLSLEPSIGFDYGVFFNAPTFNMGLSVGYAWGGRTVQEPVTRIPPRVRDGIYVGIIVFGPTAEDITGGRPIYLDRQGLDNLFRLIDTRYVGRRREEIGTALFYSIHMALANMKRAEPNLPRTLESATIVTFTDGLDVSSTGINLPNISDPGGRVVYKFPSFTRLDRPRISQWIADAGSTGLQLNSEYDDGQEFQVTRVRNNAVVYLVLDNSTSIQADQFPMIRAATKDFIQRLYDAYHQD
jgi:hypothetical protein